MKTIRSIYLIILATIVILISTSIYGVKYSTLEANVEIDSDTIEYDADNSEMMYRDDTEFNNSKLDALGFSADTAYVFDPSENKVVALMRPDIVSFPTYYKPGTYKYDKHIFIPNYTDSVLLSSSREHLVKPKEKVPIYKFATTQPDTPILSTLFKKEL